MKLQPSATEMILSHVTWCSETKWTSKDCSKVEDQGSSYKFIYYKQQQYIFVIQGLPSDLFISFENQPAEAWVYKSHTILKASKCCWFVFDLHISNTSCYRSTMDLLIVLINFKALLTKCLSWPFLFFGGGGNISVILVQLHSLKTALTPCWR